MIATLTLTLIDIAAGAAIACYCVVACALMTHRTHHLVRAAYLMLGGAGLALALLPLWHPEWLPASWRMLTLAVLCLLAIDRRHLGRISQHTCAETTVPCKLPKRVAPPSCPWLANPRAAALFVLAGQAREAPRLGPLGTFVIWSSLIAIAALLLFAPAARAVQLTAEQCDNVAEVAATFAELRDMGTDPDKYAAYMRRINAEHQPGMLALLERELRRAWAEKRTPAETREELLRRCYRARGDMGTEG